MDQKINHAIKNITIFSKKHAELLRKVMTVTDYKKGETIYWEGDAAEKLYFIVSGMVKVFKSADDGKDLVLNYFSTDDLFGELACFGPTNYTFTAEAAKDCKIGVLKQREIELLMLEKSEISIDFIKWMSYMSQYTQIKMRDLLFYGKNGALASTLIRMVHSYGKETENGIQFTTNFTNSDLAQLIGSTRETVNRMLQALKKEGAISYNQGSIVVKDLDYLKTICHCEECPLHICRL
ncbi:Crp/Fnr family transcriptional regulator [Terrilactibacillus laevilacticus]|uniref:Crp/Fnr family transcriptional regulator n=1 Tax=Terrilactibacillus laevilacticus TaxID=1380157 RepID=A0ABW5PUC0_9BACI|nr:Crp/Fnr family transcriptional regulator [Terrilactibacillus laevilacticus]